MRLVRRTVLVVVLGIAAAFLYRKVAPPLLPKPDDSGDAIEVSASAAAGPSERHDELTKRAREGLKQYAGMLHWYKRISGAFPTTEQGLNVLCNRPTIEPAPRVWRQLMPWVQAEDPWGTTYVYRYPGKAGDAFDFFSMGPDRIESGDDIKYQDDGSAQAWADAQSIR